MSLAEGWLEGNDLVFAFSPIAAPHAGGLHQPFSATETEEDLWVNIEIAGGVSKTMKGKKGNSSWFTTIDG